jgi:flagellar motor switch protein FliG
LNAVPDAERETVLREFMQAGGLGREVVFDGVELDPALADRLHLPAAYDEPAREAGRTAGDPVFQFLHDVTIDALFRHLERQHPQLIAVVTAHLPPARAAELIKRFPPRQQAELLRRVADLDVTEHEVLTDIAAELQAMLYDDLRLARNRQNGLATISSILNAAGSDRRMMMDSLSRYDGELATHLTGVPPSSTATRAEEPIRQRASARRPQLARPGSPPDRYEKRTDSSEEENAAALRLMEATVGETPSPVPPPETHVEIGFEELAGLTDQDWAILFRTAEQPIVMLALTGASEQLLQRITRRLTRREGQLLRDRLQQTGPLRLSDIEQAQRHVAEIASRLMANGQILIPERRGFAAAA